MPQPIDELGPLVWRADGGDQRAVDHLFAALYSELHRIAGRLLGRRGSDLLLGATTLLHEAYLDLSTRGTQITGKSHFMAYASRAMRALVIDSVRRHRAVKRGCEFHITAIDAHEAAGAASTAGRRLSQVVLSYGSMPMHRFAGRKATGPTTSSAEAERSRCGRRTRLFGVRSLRRFEIVQA